MTTKFLSYDDRGTYVDRSLMQADWLRTIAWDLPTTLEGFLESQGVSPWDPLETAQAEVRKFLRYPAVIPIPPDLWADLGKHGLLPEE